MEKNNLNNCSILISKTAPGNKALAEKITNQKGKSICIPSTITTSEKLSISKQSALSYADCWVFLSSNAARHAKEQLQNIRESQTIIAIGPSTRDYLESIDICVDFYPKNNYSSNGLLNLSYFQENESKKVMLICGKNSPNTLKKGLNKMGHFIAKAVTYKREIQKADIWLEQIRKNPKIDIATCHSQANLTHYSTLIFASQSYRLLNTPLLVINEKLKELAVKLGFTDVFMSHDPTPSSICKALNNWWKINSSAKELT